MALSKRVRAIREKISRDKSYGFDEAVALLKQVTSAKFDETMEVCINLGVDSRKSDQVVRGATTLPHGTGKSVRVAVFAQAASADAAHAAGADIVGFEDLAETIKKGTIDFEILIATPDAMKLVGQLGQILGPKGLMPNPKVGTVTADVASAVKNAKSGQARFRTDKNGIVHSIIGKVSFEINHLKANLEALLADLKKAKPSSAKGIYIKKITLTSTMGPGLVLDQTKIS